MLEFLKMAQKKSETPGSAKPGQKKTAQMPRYRNYPPQPVGPPEVVEPMWLLKALAGMLLLALACGYGSLCYLFYQGQWQLILHPKQTTTAPAQIAGAPVEALRFGTDESGTPQLVGWMIPAAEGGKYPGITVLYLPSGDGSLADAAGTLGLLHGMGVRVFGFDYRGYGQSVAGHPSQTRMTEDAERAFAYLRAERTVPESQIVPYGVGVGASLAVHLAAEHAGVPAVIVDTPGADPMTTVKADPRTRLLPVRLLLRDRFPLAGPLAGLKTPKLLISPEQRDARLSAAKDPKITVFGVARSNASYDTVMTEWLGRFFDEYVAAAKIRQLQESSK
jgi:pimeloyl-ACP methyl ester carboxylesterase